MENSIIGNSVTYNGKKYRLLEELTSEVVFTNLVSNFTVSKTEFSIISTINQKSKTVKNLIPNKGSDNSKDVALNTTHRNSDHAPSDAQKNSDILLSEIEAVLIGLISTHTHPGAGGETYESVSKNINSYPYVITYLGDNIDYIIYDLGASLTIIKTFNYTGDNLTSIVLSGDVPSGIDLTKTLSYTGSDLTSIIYS